MSVDDGKPAQSDSELLRTFLSMAKAGSFSGGATRMFRTQSAVSLQVQNLERAIGRRVFERHGRGVAMTAAGERLLPVARDVVEMPNQVVADLRGAPAEEEIRLGIPEQYGDTVLPSILATFTEEDPTARIFVRCSSSMEFPHALALLGFGSNAFAADAISTTEAASVPLPVASTYNWSGAYIGAQAGYAWGSSFGGGFFRTGEPDVVGSVDPRGFLGSLHAGYNYQFTSNVVIGAEADINFASIEGSVDPMHDAAGNPSPPGNLASAEMTWNGSVRLWAGYAIDRFLPYLTGGVAFGQYKYEPTYGATGPLPGSKTQTGWDVGAGLEYAFTDDLTSRIEYRYTDFGSATYDIPGFAAEETRVSLMTNDVRFGLTYRF